MRSSYLELAIYFSHFLASLFPDEMGRGGGGGSVFVFIESKSFEFLVEGGNYYLLRAYIYIYG